MRQRGEEEVLTYEDTELHMHQVPTLLSSEYRQYYRLLHDELLLCSKELRHMPSWALRDGADVQYRGLKILRNTVTILAPLARFGADLI